MAVSSDHFTFYGLNPFKGNSLFNQKQVEYWIFKFAAKNEVFVQMNIMFETLRF